MIEKYTFNGENAIEFENTRSVRELIEYAFDEFNYYEPLGMDIVTVFQAQHPETDTGWFTVNKELSCAEEIINPTLLLFAYYKPGQFYFAEGGWGHHMPELGNRPEIPNEVLLKIRVEDFEATIVINGNYTFMDVVNTLRMGDYISGCNSVKVLIVGVGRSYCIPFSDPIMRIKLTDFAKKIEQYSKERLESGECYYHNILSFV